MAKKKPSAVPLPEKLLLFRYLLREFGLADFPALQAQFSSQRLDAAATSPSLLVQNLIDLPERRVASELLRQFDENLTQHLRYINQGRPRPLSLTYFQYFGLLFAEYYLHHYFQDADNLLTRLNDFRFEYCTRHPLASEVTPYTPDDLNKLAYWSATGSGKTLLLNINLLQYAHYCPPSRLRNRLVLTPDDKLSTQHLESLHHSNFTDARAYIDQPTGSQVKVIDLHKLYDRAKGEKKAPVDVAVFEDQNALFVDEGHLGSTQEESTWRGYRQKLALGGFTFEYSATFGQLQQADIQNEYAKCILFDYSYRHFHNDGYGKDYRIDNIDVGQAKDLLQAATKRAEKAGQLAKAASPSTTPESSGTSAPPSSTANYPYLLTNLLLFLQQQQYYQLNHSALEPYHFEAPLLLFVGHTVNAGKADDLDADTISDVQRVLRFLDYLLTQPTECQELLAAIREGRDDYASFYHQRLTWLLARPEASTSAQLYELLLTMLFHTAVPGTLELHTLSQATGEVGLKVSGNNPYFGLVYIGDVSKFKSGLGGDFAVESDRLTPSLFEQLDTAQAKPVNLLLGARRFIVGWNSFRVTGIGLINFGKSEGTQIIQLFGRGVRLRGREDSLKRTRPGEGIDGHQPLLETLNVFGLDATYIKKFRDELARAGVGTRHRTIPVPVVPYTTPAGASLDTLGLLTLQRDTTAQPFADTPPVRLLPSTKPGMYIRLDLATRHTHVVGETAGAEPTQPRVISHVADLPSYYSLLDWELLYRRWNQYRQRKGYRNLVLAPADLRALLQGIGYEVALDAPFQPRTPADLARLQQLVEMVLHRYTDRYYARRQRAYEGQHLRAVALTPDHPAVSGWEYAVELTETDEQGEVLPDFVQLLARVQTVLATDYPNQLKPSSTALRAALFETHLYHPVLLDLTDQPAGIAAVRPAGLNPDEHVFMSHLRRYIVNNRHHHPDSEFYLLRNAATRDRGVGFYFSVAGGFFPDFMLWIKQPDKQHLAFIDPHGLRNELGGFSAEKIQLHQRIKEVERNLAVPGLHLHSFVLSPNSFAKARITEWAIPAGADFNDYAASQHVYALPTGGAPAEAPYVEKMIAQIIA